MKWLIGAMALGLATLSALATLDNKTTFSGSLRGHNEEPPVESAGSGYVSMSYSPGDNQIVYTVWIRNMSGVTGVYLRQGGPRDNGQTVFTLYSGVKSGPFTGVLAEGVIRAYDIGGPYGGEGLEKLMKEMSEYHVYAEVETRDYPAGEIRGQVH